MLPGLAFTAMEESNPIKENKSQYFHKKLVFAWICFSVPKLDITKIVLETVDHIPTLNIKTPSNSAMVTMHSSIFRYLNVRTLAMISKTTSRKHTEQLQLSSVCYFHNLLCSVGIFVMTEGKQPCFMGTLGMK